MSTSEVRAQFATASHVITTAASFAARATLGVFVGGLFLFYTSMALLATRSEFLLGNPVEAIVGLVILTPITLGSATYTFYTLSPETDRF